MHSPPRKNSDFPKLVFLCCPKSAVSSDRLGHSASPEWCGFRASPGSHIVSVPQASSSILRISPGSSSYSSMKPCLPTPAFTDFPFPEPSGSYLYHSFGSCEGVSNLVNHLYVSIGLISSNNYNLEIRGQTFHIGELSTQHLAPSKP